MKTLFGALSSISSELEALFSKVPDGFSGGAVSVQMFENCMSGVSSRYILRLVDSSVSECDTFYYWHTLLNASQV